MILLNKPNPTIEAELHNQTATEIIGNLTIHKSSYDSALVNIVEMNGRLMGVTVDSEYFTQLQKGSTYQYHFLRLDPRKTYGIEASAIPKGEQPSSRRSIQIPSLQITNCSGQIINGWLCSTTIPGAANFSD